MMRVYGTHQNIYLHHTPVTCNQNISPKKHWCNTKNIWDISFGVWYCVFKNKIGYRGWLHQRNAKDVRKR